MKFGMQAVMTAQAGKGEELATIMLEASALVADMQGCEIHLVQQSVVDEAKVMSTEVWTSKADHQASLANPWVRALIADAKPLIAGMEHHPATPLGGKGL
ncbi:MAG: quinol monooxygenase YgiN [Paraglaciecola sp.]|jgi:quinol monooxygenase YgiN